MRLAERNLRAVLLDIEGTTTPIAFVHETLFPFARAHLDAYLESQRHSREIQEVLELLAAEHQADRAAGTTPPDWRTGSLTQTVQSIGAYARWLMDEDRKSTGLKLLQGYIWERGYEAGELRGQVYPDVAPALERWHGAGITAAIYSSGSELAQRRLFESTEAGDLTPFLAGFFDTTIGPKQQPDSYRRIGLALRTPVEQMLFVSDVEVELMAARQAGLSVALCVRPGNPEQPHEDDFEPVLSLDDLR